MLRTLQTSTSFNQPDRHHKAMRLTSGFFVFLFGFALISSLFISIPQKASAATLTCVEKSYSYGSSSTCVKYAKQLVNGITTKFSGTRYAFSTEALTNTTLYISNSFNSTTKKRLINFQRWGYKLSTAGTLNAGTWKELCGFAKTTMLASASPWSNTIKTMHSAYENASCFKIGVSYNPQIRYSSIPEAEFGIGTWNSLYSNSSNIATGVKSMLSTNGLDVVGLQEVHRGAQRDRIKSMICTSCAQSGYIPSYSGGNAGPGSYPIVWDREVFSRAGSGSYKKVTDYLYYANNRLLPRYLTWVRLEHNATGKKFYIINTHYVSAVDVDGKFGPYANMNEGYKQHMAQLITLVSSLKAEDTPIYIVGDFNVDYRKDVIIHTPGFPYASLTPIAMKSNWEITNLSGIDPANGTFNSRNILIDYVYVWQRPDVTMVSNAIISSGYGSDHYPVVSKIKH